MKPDSMKINKPSKKQDIGQETNCPHAVIAVINVKEKTGLPSLSRIYDSASLQIQLYFSV